MSGHSHIFDRPSEHIPTVILNFGVVSTKVDTDVVPTIIIQIKCRECDGMEFDIFELKSKDNVVGCSLSCRSCGRNATLFNASTDGYDGVFGHNDDLKGPTTTAPIDEHNGTNVLSGKFSVNFTYNSEDLDEMATEADRPPQDLFDWIEVYVLKGDQWEQVWDYECA